ncbi:MAG: galactosyldiacylglycerol synthase [Anaerolineae bacterium]
MVQMFDAASGASLGQITDDQLQFLVDHMEEESDVDQDYYINQDTLDMFEGEGGDPALILLLRQALGSRDDMDIRWARS